jgi:hypothetical protein
MIYHFKGKFIIWTTIILLIDFTLWIFLMLFRNRRIVSFTLPHRYNNHSSKVMTSISRIIRFIYGNSHMRSVSISRGIFCIDIVGIFQWRRAMTEFECFYSNLVGFAGCWLGAGNSFLQHSAHWNIFYKQERIYEFQQLAYFKCWDSSIEEPSAALID